MLVHGRGLHEDDRRRPRRVVDVKAHAQPVGFPLEDGAVAAHELDDPVRHALRVLEDLGGGVQARLKVRAVIS